MTRFALALCALVLASCDEGAAPPDADLVDAAPVDGPPSCALVCDLAQHIPCAPDNMAAGCVTIACGSETPACNVYACPDLDCACVADGTSIPLCP